MLQFQGQLLGSSSSKRYDSARWIEFAIYKTEKGTYVLTRVGVSNIFHSLTCPLVKRYGLHELPSDSVSPNAVPCEECHPSTAEPFLFPETYRYWTMTSDEPEAILEALYKKDDFGARYLTKVAERVLQEAAENDPELDSAYRIEFID